MMSQNRNSPRSGARRSAADLRARSGGCRERRRQKRPLPGFEPGLRMCNPLPYHLAKGPGHGNAGRMYRPCGTLSMYTSYCIGSRASNPEDRVRNTEIDHPSAWLPGRIRNLPSLATSTSISRRPLSAVAAGMPMPVSVVARCRGG